MCASTARCSAILHTAAVCNAVARIALTVDPLKIHIIFYVMYTVKVLFVQNPLLRYSDRITTFLKSDGARPYIKVCRKTSAKCLTGHNLTIIGD